MQNKSTKPGDAEIVRQVIDGNVNAFEHLMLRYEDVVLKIVKRHVPYSEVEETVQDAFVRAYQSLPTFKGKGGFGQWISSIAVRTCYDYWRRAYRSREVPISSLTQNHREWLEKVLSDESERPDDQEGMGGEAGEFLEWALGKLAPGERMVLELVYLEGLSGKEAADLLGCSVASVKVRSFRSRKKLEKLISEEMKGRRRR